MTYDQWKTGAKYLVVEPTHEDYGRVREADRYDVENFSLRYLPMVDELQSEEDAALVVRGEHGYLMVPGKYALNGFAGVEVNVEPTEQVEEVQDEEVSEESEHAVEPRDTEAELSTGEDSADESRLERGEQEDCPLD